MINCYYYAPHNHTILARYLKDDFARMRDMGTDTVSVCVQEEQLVNWHQKRLHNAVDLAHDAGLKVHAVPNRWAGLVAGWLDGFGRFTLDRSDTIIRDKSGHLRMTKDGNCEMQSCTQNPAVREHMEKTIQTMMTNFDFEGIIWDEPHAQPCHCDYCKKASGNAVTPAWQEAQTAHFLDEMSAYAKTFKPDMIASCFVMPHCDGLLNAFLKTKRIDYLGSDGHIRSSSHAMHRMKGTIFEAHEKMYPLIHNAGKKTFFLLEAQRHRDEDLADYISVVDKAFALPMDHLMYYYSAHEMSVANEAAFNNATWNALKKHAGK
jgi:hypothetical protein